MFSLRARFVLLWLFNLLFAMLVIAFFTHSYPIIFLQWQLTYTHSKAFLHMEVYFYGFIQRVTSPKPLFFVPLLANDWKHPQAEKRRRVYTVKKAAMSGSKNKVCRAASNWKVNFTGFSALRNGRKMLTGKERWSQIEMFSQRFNWYGIQLRDFYLFTLKFESWDGFYIYIFWRWRCYFLVGRK
jgi:hypothetical protein